MLPTSLQCNRLWVPRPNELGAGGRLFRPERIPRRIRASLPYDVEQSGPPDVERPRPRARQLEGVRVVNSSREEDDVCSADQVSRRHEADSVLPRGYTAIYGVVPVVAHHEVLA